MDPIQDIDSPTLMKSVVRYQGTSLVIVALFGVFAALFSFISTREVSATATIGLSDPRGVTLASGAGSNSNDLTRYTADRADFARSDRVIRAAAALDGHISQTDLRDRLSTSPSPTADIFKVTVRDKNPERARDIANEVATVFERQQRADVKAQAAAAFATLDRTRAQALSDLERLGDGPNASSQRSSVSDVLTQLSSRRTEIGIELGSFGSGVEYIDPAQTPAASVISTDLVRNLLAGLIFGAFVAMFAAWLRASASRVIGGSEIAAAKVGLPVLGEIPEYGRRTLSSARTFANLPLIEYQFVASNLSMRVKSNGVLVVAGLKPGDGATISAANIAAAAAVDGQRVLLVDANARDAGLTRLLGWPVSRNGLLNVLAGSGTLVDAITPVTLKTFATVSVIPIGSAGVDGAAVLRGARLASLFEALRMQFDLVVVDGPPVLTVPDSLSLTMHADALLLVLRQGMASADAERLHQQIEFLSDRAIGFVFTRGGVSEVAREYRRPDGTRGKARRRT